MLLVFLVDALRHDYVDSESAPFLRRLADQGLTAVLKPAFGFEPDFAYLAGLGPGEACGGAQFIRSPATSPFRHARFIPRWFNQLPRIPNKLIRKSIERLARRGVLSPFGTTAYVPFDELPKFDLAVREALDSPGVWRSPSIFDYLRETGRTWLSHWAPQWAVNANAALDRARKDLRPPLALALFHIGNLDRIGHRHGPESAERRREMTVVDDAVRQICALGEERFKTCDVVVFGDHGMARVVDAVDIMAALRKLPWQAGSDYDIFLDSTMARCWINKEPARGPILDTLHGLRNGRVLSDADRARYDLNYPDRRFGDIFFVANAGTLVSPNYYQGKSRVLGMHGYLPEAPDQQSALLALARGRSGTFESPVDMRRLFPTFLDLLDLTPRPGTGSPSLLAS
jgi:predicted AlkP superfamily pyrophosphatase or phosphodiesterase